MKGYAMIRKLLISFIMTITIGSVAYAHEIGERLDLDCSLLRKPGSSYVDHWISPLISNSLIQQLYDFEQEEHVAYTGQFFVEIEVSGKDFEEPERLSTIGDISLRYIDKKIIVKARAHIQTNRVGDKVKLLKCYMR